MTMETHWQVVYNGPLHKSRGVYGSKRYTTHHTFVNIREHEHAYSPPQTEAEVFELIITLVSRWTGGAGSLVELTPASAGVMWRARQAEVARAQAALEAEKPKVERLSPEAMDRLISDYLAGKAEVDSRQTGLDEQPVPL